MVQKALRGKNILELGKEVQNNLNLAYDFVRIEKIKKEVLVCQSITTH